MKTTSTDELAKILWNYNNLKQELVISDAILVLGSNDIRIARYGAELFFQKYAPIIIFSGGFGALTKYLFDKPEAEIFAAEAIKLGVPEDRIFIENQSTNTGDNIIKSKKLIRDNNMAISSFIVVQKPYMLRQAYATFMKQWPEKYIVVSGPKISYESYPDNIITKELLINLLVGDTQRIRIYPERGFQISQDIPDKVWSAYQELVKRGFTKHLV